MRVRIHKYSATVSRNATDGSNAAEHVRYLFLEGKSLETENNFDFTIAFHETDVSDMGNVHPEAGAAVNLPIRDFTVMYHMVQTEKLITATFEVDENNKLTFFTISAHDRLIGEVPTNSPDLNFPV